MLVTSCNSRQADDHEHSHHADSEESAHHHDDGEPIELNNGEKWGADEHTLSVVEDMKSEVSGLAGVGEKNHGVLAESLTRQLNVLIAGCTMTGEAHDQLHKWLVPFMDNVKQLAVAETESEAGREVAEIEEGLHTGRTQSTSTMLRERPSCTICSLTLCHNRSLGKASLYIR